MPRPLFNRRNLYTAIRHPSMVLAFLRGEGSVELGRKLIGIQVSWLERSLATYGLLTGIQHEGSETLELLMENMGEIIGSSRSYFEPAPQILFLLARVVKPRIAVETGVHFGVSTSFILHAMKKNSGGHLYSIDCPEAECSAPESQYAP